MTDEFHQADRDDRAIDRAFDEDMRRDDWDELHGMSIARPICPRCRGKGYVMTGGPDRYGNIDTDECPVCAVPDG